jgi:hypothetical protein
MCECVLDFSCSCRSELAEVHREHVAMSDWTVTVTGFCASLGDAGSRPVESTVTNLDFTSSVASSTLKYWKTPWKGRRYRMGRTKSRRNTAEAAARSDLRDLLATSPQRVYMLSKCLSLALVRYASTSFGSNFIDTYSVTATQSHRCPVERAFLRK